MFRYIIFGLVVESDIEILSAELLEDTCNDVDVYIEKKQLSTLRKEIEEFAEANPPSKEDLEKMEEWRDPNIRTIYRFDKNESIYSVSTVAIFRMRQGRYIDYDRVPDSDVIHFNQWLLCMALTVILAQRDEVVLHGSGLGLVHKKGSFAICGGSGSGKSTTTEALLDRGYRFKTDDIIPVQCETSEVKMVGSFATRRLCKNVVEERKLDTKNMIYMYDGGREKYILPMKESYDSDGENLKALFYICPDKTIDSVCIKEIIGHAKLSFLNQCLYRVDCYEVFGKNPILFKKILQIAKEVSIYEIRRPIDKNTVNEIVDCIEQRIN